MTKSISLNEELADFANKQAEQGCYRNVSAYFADLLRKTRQAEIDADLKFLEDATKNSALAPPPVKKIVAACKAVRKQMQREGWGKK